MPFPKDLFSKISEIVEKMFVSNPEETVKEGIRNRVAAENAGGIRRGPLAWGDTDAAAKKYIAEKMTRAPAGATVATPAPPAFGDISAEDLSAAVAQLMKQQADIDEQYKKQAEARAKKPKKSKKVME